MEKILDAILGYGIYLLGLADLAFIILFVYIPNLLTDNSSKKYTLYGVLIAVIFTPIIYFAYKAATPLGLEKQAGIFALTVYAFTLFLLAMLYSIIYEIWKNAEHIRAIRRDVSDLMHKQGLTTTYDRQIAENYAVENMNRNWYKKNLGEDPVPISELDEYVQKKTNERVALAKKFLEEQKEKEQKKGFWSKLLTKKR